MNNPDHISEGLETIFWVKILQFFYADMGSRREKFGSGMEKFGSGMKKFESGSGMEKLRIRIRDGKIRTWDGKNSDPDPE